MSEPDRFIVPEPTEPAFVRPNRPARRLGIGLVVVLVPLFVGWVVVTKVLYKPYRLVSPSMNATLDVGDRILVRRHAGTPRPGEIVAVRPPKEYSSFSDQCAGGQPASGAPCLTPGHGEAGVVTVQRIAGGPGDRLELRGGRLFRNGRATDPSTVRPCTDRSDDTCNLKPFTVPAGLWFTLGDNRGNAADGRYWGPVRASQIVGRVAAIYWPWGRLGGVS